MKRAIGTTIMASIAVLGVVVLLSSITQRIPSGSAQLVSVEPLPVLGEMCLPESANDNFNPTGELRESNLFAALGEGTVYAAVQGAPGRGPIPPWVEVRAAEEISRPPLRYVRDLDPIYTYVAVDTRRNEVLMQDVNTFSIRVFNRTENTPANLARTEPKRIIGGTNTKMMFNTCIYIDPQNSDIYTVENDFGDTVSVFSENMEGNAVPLRSLHVTHRAYGLAVDEEKQELFVSVQYPPGVEVYRKTASGDEKPLRVLSGESTRLADTHGIAIDPKNKLLFVNNWGHVSQFDLAGSGRFEPPSISVYPLDAKGDASPLRVIQGPKTQLDWPGQMAFDPETGDLYVANDITNSVLVFSGTDNGNVAPSRVIKGGKTGVSSPVSVSIDAKNRELWVANMGNASATVYPLGAKGDSAPLRTIRSAPVGKISLAFGKLQAVIFDTKRQQILVPN